MQDLQNLQTLSVPEAGKLLGVSRCTAFKLAHKGQLPVIRVGEHKLRVPVRKLEEMLDRAGRKVEVA